MAKTSKDQILLDEIKVLDALEHHSKDSVDEIAKSCGFSRQKVWRIISDLFHRRIVGRSSFGKSVSRSYIYPEKGSYQIRVKAMDEHYVQGDWSDPLTIIMPHSYDKPISHFLQMLFQRFSNAYLILPQLMEN